MQFDKIVQAYQQHDALKAFGGKLKDAQGKNFHIKGMAGSQAVLVIAALFRITQRNIVVILNDKEEALYFQNDLQGLMPRKSMQLFPASYKRPYQVEEVDNANVLQRAEVLNALNHTQTGRQVIITYAEAISEQVINKRSLVQNTLEIKESENCGMDFVIETLEEYGFEREDFVYEPGQYAVRGGILDVYSFAHELPYRIEFFGEEIESIRTFDPASQMSEGKVKQISIIPNIQQHLKQEEHISFLEYISGTSILFLKSIEFVKADLDRIYDKAEQLFEELKDKSGGGATSSEPQELYVSGDEFVNELLGFSRVEIGNNTFYKSYEEQLEWKGSGQPSFQKEFGLLADHLLEIQEKGFSNLILANNEKQLLRIEEILDQTNEKVKVEGVLGELHEGFLDPQLKLCLYTDHQIFDRYHRYKSKAQKKRSQAITLKELRELNPRDFVVHVHHGIGQFAGLHTIRVGEHLQEVVKIIYKKGDSIYVNVNSLHKISKYSGKEGTTPKINALGKAGAASWAKTKTKTKNRIKQLAFNLVDLYAKRKATPGFAFKPDDYMQQELEASFMYEDTPDQNRTTSEVKDDMEKSMPMDRLVCGDVGFGKTEIAVRAAFKSAVNGKQVAILVPTTILALQHWKTFTKRLKEFPVKVDFVNRFRSSKEIKETLKGVAEGKVDILIGTHRLVSKDVKFKDLGLLIIDEEQRFGVNVKDKLKTIRANVDTLTLTATPIPRTLQFSLSGIRDLSVISTPPPNRQPIETVKTGFGPEQIRDAIAYELKRGGQVFFIHPRVRDIIEIAGSIKKLVPDARIKIAHGQMKGSELEEVMAGFIEGDFDVLVSTTIVESGLDIPNANTIVINEANMYGLADLHQMRGRVGRANRKAFCYLLAPPDISLSPDARKRLKAMEEFTDLGSGFHIALRDLDIRGAGDMLGPDQSGFIADVGYDLYHKILDEAIQELQEEHFSELFKKEIEERKTIIVNDCQIDLELELRIPEGYLPNTAERLHFYRRIANAASEEELRDLMREMIDRCGPMPDAVLNLFDATRIRELAKRSGIERIVLKQGILRLFMVADKQSAFYQSPQFLKLIEYAQLYSAKAKLKESEKYLSLIYQGIDHIKTVVNIVLELHNFLNGIVPEEEVGVAEAEEGNALV